MLQRAPTVPGAANDVATRAALKALTPQFVGAAVRILVNGHAA